VLNGYGRLYDRVSLAVRRRQELAADVAAARVAGAATTAAALRSTHAVAAAWARHGGEPTTFAAMLATPEYGDLLVRHRARPREHLAARDSHPALARRLALLARRSDEPTPWKPPESLLADPPALFGALPAAATTRPRPAARGGTVSVALSLGLLVIALLSLHRVSRAPAPATESPPAPAVTTELPRYSPTVPDSDSTESLDSVESIARLASEPRDVPTH
jgi:hypothetical protein